MHRLFVNAMALLTVSVAGAIPVGEKVETVTVPVGTVTVSAKPLAAVTVSESSVTYAPNAVIPTREGIVGAVRERGNEAERLRALDRVWDQDDVFYLFLKPGEDCNKSVRVAAVDRLTEIEVLRAIDEKIDYPEVKEAIENRLKGVYRSKADRPVSVSSSVSREYARRMRERQP